LTDTENSDDGATQDGDLGDERPNDKKGCRTKKRIRGSAVPCAGTIENGEPGRRRASEVARSHCLS
jgi:hypothetical protein